MKGEKSLFQAAFYGLVIGLIIGIIRMGMSWARSAGQCGGDKPDTQFSIIRDVHYLHFAIILGALVSIVIVLVTMVTEPRPAEKVRETLYNSNSYLFYSDLMEINTTVIHPKYHSS